MKNDSIIKENLYKNPLLDVYIPSNLKNSFKMMEKEKKELPLYEDVKADLPKPFWEGHESVIETYNKSWEIAFGNLKKCGEGFVSNYIDTAFNDYIFLWDSAFMTLFGRYADHVFSFQNTLNNFYYVQELDGFIGRELHKESGQCRYHRFDPVSTGGNLFAWVEMIYYSQFRNKERLEQVFPVILAYHRWLRMHRTWKDGSYWSCGWACGMDNQMRVSKEVYDYSYHDYRTWVDVCIQQVLSCKELIKMHKILGGVIDIKDIEKELNDLTELINAQLWDEESSFYYDADRDGKLDKNKSIGAYWALIADIMPENRKEKLVEQLRDEEEFMTANPIPTMPKSNSHFDETGNYWRGGVWAPMNYMVLKGLEKNGYDNLCFEIGSKHLEHVVRVFKETGTLWENYRPNEAKRGEPSKPNFVGWTGLSPISIFIEYVLGIRFDYEAEQLIWNVNLLEEHGIEHLPFGKYNFASLKCNKRKSKNEEPLITYLGENKPRLVISWDGKEKII